MRKFKFTNRRFSSSGYNLNLYRNYSVTGTGADFTESGRNSHGWSMVGDSSFEDVKSKTADYNIYSRSGKHLS